MIWILDVESNITIIIINMFKLLQEIWQNELMNMDM